MFLMNKDRIGVTNMLSASKIKRYVKRSIEIKKGLDSPILLIHFITSNCNLKCNHCFYWQDINKIEELGLEHVKKVVSSLKPLDTVMLTGGEPFLSKDLVEICQIYSEKAQNINITTNGFLSEAIFEKTRSILEKTRSNIHIQVSLDSLRDKHDALRGVEGSFDNAVKTVKKLKEIRNPKFSINVLTTISNYNYKDIDELSEFVHSLGVEHAFEMVRGTSFVKNNRKLADFNPKSEECALPPSDELEKIYSKLKENYKKYNSKKGLLDRPLVIFLAKLRLSIDTLKMNKKFVDCPAGNLIGVIYPDGNVSVCEFFPPRVNLKDFDYNFYKLWNSEVMKQEKDKVKGCFCIHGCFLQSAVFYSPKMYSKFVLKNLIKRL